MNTERLDELLDKYWWDGFDVGAQRRRIVKEIRAAIHAEVERLVAEERGWRSIETAPKDGTEILIANAGWLVEFVTWTDGCWRDRMHEKLRNATHWMPCPDAPRGVDNTTTTNVADHQEAS